MPSKQIKSDPKQVTQAELRRAFNMAMRDWKSPQTLAFHRAIAKRLDAGAKTEQAGPYKANAYHSANGSLGLNVERTYTVNPSLQSYLAVQLLDEQIALLQDARKKAERAFLKGADRKQLGSKVRPAVIKTGRDAGPERE